MEKFTYSTDNAVKNKENTAETLKKKTEDPEAYERMVNSLVISLTAFFGSIVLIPAKYIVRALALESIQYTGQLNFVHYFVNVHDIFVIISSLILVAMVAKVCINDKKDEFGLKTAFKIALVVASISAAISVTIGFTDNFDDFETQYQEAIALMEAERYEEAEGIFGSLNDYKRSYYYYGCCYDEMQNAKYTNAMNFIAEGEYVEAYKILEGLGGYGNSQEMMESIYDEYCLQLLVRAEVGETVFFGSYEQRRIYTNYYDDNNEYLAFPIEWTVIAKKDGKALLLSKYVLDCQPFSDSGDCTSWESSHLRAWLNNAFFNHAFTAEEQLMIVDTYLPADPNPKYGTEQGNATTDRVFALSVREVKDYLDRDYERMAEATSYAIYERNAYRDGSYWWTRTMGYSSDYATLVWSNGGINENGESVYTSNVGVRPAIWIELPQ